MTCVHLFILILFQFNKITNVYVCVLAAARAFQLHVHFVTGFERRYICITSYIYNYTLTSSAAAASTATANKRREKMTRKKKLMYILKIKMIEN